MFTLNRANRIQHTIDHRKQQSGIGLIEVILAMLIFAFAALAAGNIQTVSLGSANVANMHDDVNAFAHEMLEALKADRGNATAMQYNCLLYTSDAADE